MSGMLREPLADRVPARTGAADTNVTTYTVWTLTMTYRFHPVTGIILGGASLRKTGPHNLKKKGTRVSLPGPPFRLFP